MRRGKYRPSPKKSEDPTVEDTHPNPHPQMIEISPPLDRGSPSRPVPELVEQSPDTMKLRPVQKKSTIGQSHTALLPIPDKYSESEASETENVGVETDSEFASTDESDMDKDFDAEDEIYKIKSKLRKIREFELELDRKIV
jgi:hypothetical protein